MTATMSRAERIRCRFNDFAAELPALISVPEPVPWGNVGRELSAPISRFGYLTPVIAPADSDRAGELIIAFCPEVIAAQTAHLSDEELDDYLEAVHSLLGAYIIIVQDHEDEGERLLAAERFLADEIPGELDIISNVQAYAIDHGLA